MRRGARLVAKKYAGKPGDSRSAAVDGMRSSPYAVLIRQRGSDNNPPFEGEVQKNSKLPVFYVVRMIKEVEWSLARIIHDGSSRHRPKARSS